MYTGTALVAQGGIEEINRAILDLLKKINEQAKQIAQMEKIVKELKDAS